MDENKIKKIVQSYDTPVYVFDIGVLKKRIQYLQEHLPKDVELCYAVKANTFLIKEINQLLDRFEVCSPGEAYICQGLNIPMEKLVISGVYKTPSFVKELIMSREKVGLFTVESLQQLKLIKNAASKYNTRVRVLLRITSGNQFGLNESEVRELIKKRDKMDCIDICGLQYFSGTQKQSLKKLKRELDYLDQLMQALSKDYGFETRELEFGPGFPVAYFQTEDFDETTFLEEFSNLLNNMSYKTKITLELGRSIAANCGSYMSKVVDKKTNKRENYAILDGGIHHLVYYGQSMAMKVPRYQIFPDRDETEYKNWNLCGSLCTVNDILVKQLPVCDLKIGDVFVFANTGAYCMTEGISLFLSRELPQILILDENEKIISVREHISTDILNSPNYKEEKEQWKDLSKY